MLMPIFSFKDSNEVAVEEEKRRRDAVEIYPSTHYDLGEWEPEKLWRESFGRIEDSW